MINNLWFAILVFITGSISSVHAQSPVTLENQNFRIVVDQKNGAMSSFLVKANHTDLISEHRLIANYRICIPLKDYITNYIEGMEQEARSVIKEGNQITVTVSGMHSPKGTYDIGLVYRIRMEDHSVSFSAKLTNNDTNAISEFWFPRIGGIKNFGTRDAKLAIPRYNQDTRPSISLFTGYPGSRGLGAEAAEWSTDYPGMTMPWWDLYDAKNNVGLYMGYEDTIFRYSTWHTYLAPNSTGLPDAYLKENEAAGQPVGLTFSHVRYPFIHSGETFQSGEFVVRVHSGDWHEGSLGYRKWFLTHFPIDKSDSWLRKENSWFTAIISQPEDKILTDYKGYDQWTKDASKYGIGCNELIGWNHGGLERNYPLYVPEEKLGGKEGFKTLLRSIKDRGDKCLVFVNYNILDKSTDWYKKDLFRFMSQDQFGNQGIWMAWGEGTLLARKTLNTRYHVRSSVVPEMEKILEAQLLPLVRDGAQGFQIDKLVVGSSLDFNPLNTAKPDVALCENLVQAIARLYAKCRAINPQFRMASEFLVDRMIPYFDVAYRQSSGGSEISSMRYVFPEWTSCQHISTPRDFNGVNGAVLTGSVICVEPDSYQTTLDQPLYHDIARYIKEVGRIRQELADVLFLGKYYDNQGAEVNTVKKQGNLAFKVHGSLRDGRKAITITNNSQEAIQYTWKFTGAKTTNAYLYSPFEKARPVKAGETLTIQGSGLHIIVADTLPR